MVYDRFTLEVETVPGANVKVVWTAYSKDDSFQAQPYFLSPGLFLQAGEEVRKILHRLAMQDNYRDERDYWSLVDALRDRSVALFRNLFQANGSQVTDEIVDLLRLAATGSSKAILNIIICDESIHIPWGFVCDPGVSQPIPGPSPSIADFTGFWLSSFKLITRYQGGHLLSSERKPGWRTLFALHQDEFEKARKLLRTRNDEIDQQLDTLLTIDAKSVSTWTECGRYWSTIAEDYDSILYMFGHSNGEYILLADRDTVDYVLPASSFSTKFPKERRTRSASICILNGCRTAAPMRTSPWPATFLKATREPGFFGFVGTEVEVPNDFASLYGVKLLWRLIRGGQVLGEAFDELRQDRELFPRSLVYSCYADRNFKLPIAHPVTECKAIAA
jgi:hypothetical protein